MPAQTPLLSRRVPVARKDDSITTSDSDGPAREKVWVMRSRRKGKGGASTDEDGSDSGEDAKPRHHKGRHGRMHFSWFKVKMGILILLVAIAAGAGFYYRTTVIDFVTFPATKTPVNPADQLTSAVVEAATKAASAVVGAEQTATSAVAGAANAAAGAITGAIGGIKNPFGKRGGAPTPSSGW